MPGLCRECCVTERFCFAVQGRLAPLRRRHLAPYRIDLTEKALEQIRIRRFDLEPANPRPHPVEIDVMRSAMHECRQPRRLPEARSSATT
jgi:hypothetical protein